MTNSSTLHEKIRLPSVITKRIVFNLEWHCVSFSILCAKCGGWKFLLYYGEIYLPTYAPWKRWRKCVCHPFTSTCRINQPTDLQNLHKHSFCRIVFSGINLFKMSNLQFWVKLLVALIITPTLYNLILPATGGCCSQTRHDDMLVSHLYTEQKMFLAEALCNTLLSIPPAFRQVQHIRENVKTDSVECLWFPVGS